jgi:uncharacterized protein YkwD
MRRRILLSVSTLLLLGALATAPAASGSVPAAPARPAARPAAADRPFAQQVLAEINVVRRESGRAALSRSAQLARAAQRQAGAMGRLGFFSHSSPDGSSPGRRITTYYHVAGATSWAVGEVIFWDDVDTSVAAVVAAWLASSSHHETLLSGRWREVGVGVVRVVNAGGVYGGKDVLIVVADFGRRS